MRQTADLVRIRGGSASMAAHTQMGQFCAHGSQRAHVLIPMGSDEDIQSSAAMHNYADHRITQMAGELIGSRAANR